MALKGRKYCQFHGGRRAVIHRRKDKRLPGFYSRHLGPTLKAKLEELTKVPAYRARAIDEEIAVLRAMADECMKLACPVLDPPPGMESKITSSMRGMAIDMVKDAMKTVIDAVDKASSIEAKASDKISIKLLDLFITQIMRCIHEELSAAFAENGVVLAERICKRIEDTVRLPNAPIQSMDANIEASIIQSSIEPTIQAMDATTTASSSESVLPVDSEIQCSSSGSEEWEDGDSEEEASEEVSGEETMG